MNAPSRAPQLKRDWLDWPFFGEFHRAFAGALDCFAASGALAAIDHEDVDGSCRKLVRALGEAGLLDAAVAPPDGDASGIDSRSVCLARETLAYHDGLADFAFAMQGLGSGAVAIAGSDEQRRRVLPKVRRGEWVAAFALSEKEAGSDVRRRRLARRARTEADIVRTARRPGSRMAGSPTSTRCSPAPAKRQARAAFPRFCSFRRSRFLDRRAHRRDGPASPGHASFRRPPVFRNRSAARRSRRGLQDRHAHTPPNVLPRSRTRLVLILILIPTPRRCYCHASSRVSIPKKSNVQKSLFLIKTATQIDVPFTFVLFKHGPYSFELETELEQMKSCLAITPEPDPNGYGVVLSPGPGPRFVDERGGLNEAESNGVERVCRFVEQRIVRRLGLEMTLPPLGRPKKEHNGSAPLFGFTSYRYPHISCVAEHMGLKKSRD